MFNTIGILKKEFVEKLTTGFKQTYGGLNSNFCEIIEWAGNMVLELIANSNALYHNVEHTILVTLVGQEILKGKHIIDGGITPLNWLNCIVSLLCHDIGYIRGLCKQDSMEDRLFATGKKFNEVVRLKEGATDASLTPWHVDRGKLFIDERFGNHSILNIEKIKTNIELTRFPIPNIEEMKVTGEFDFPSAADLIGQLGDPRYLQKCAALFYEFEEIGSNKKFGYKSPDDLVKTYPKFFWNTVYNKIKPAIKYLRITSEGKLILASLYSNVFSVEHEMDFSLNSNVGSPSKNQLIIIEQGSISKSTNSPSQQIQQKDISVISFPPLPEGANEKFDKMENFVPKSTDSSVKDDKNKIPNNNNNNNNLDSLKRKREEEKEEPSKKRKFD